MLLRYIEVPSPDNEPATGSVILAWGSSGTAFQKFYSDDLWHATTGKVMSWEELVDMEAARADQYGNQKGFYILLDTETD